MEAFSSCEDEYPRNFWAEEFENSMQRASDSNSTPSLREENAFKNDMFVTPPSSAARGVWPSRQWKAEAYRMVFYTARKALFADFDKAASRVPLPSTQTPRRATYEYVVWNKPGLVEQLLTPKLLCQREEWAPSNQYAGTLEEGSDCQTKEKEKIYL